MKNQSGRDSFARARLTGAIASLVFVLSQPDRGGFASAGPHAFLRRWARHVWTVQSESAADFEARLTPANGMTVRLPELVKAVTELNELPAGADEALRGGFRGLTALLREILTGAVTPDEVIARVSVLMPMLVVTASPLAPVRDAAVAVALSERLLPGVESAVSLERMTAAFTAAEAALN